MKIKQNLAAVSKRSDFETESLFPSLSPAQAGMLPKNLYLKAGTELLKEPITEHLIRGKKENVLSQSF